MTIATPAVTARAIARARATREGDAKKNRAIRMARASFDATIVGGACVVALAGRARAVLAGDTPPGGVGPVDGYFNSRATLKDGGERVLAERGVDERGVRGRRRRHRELERRRRAGYE